MTNDWRFSLHGGHNSESSRHASSDIDALVTAAEQAGLATFGLVAHEPRREERFVYAEERVEGVTPDDLAADYARFLERSAKAIAVYRGPVHLLRGIELENLPPLEEWGGAPPRPSSWREDGLDFAVGSAHWVRGIAIDTGRQEWERAAEACGGPAGLVERYYEELGASVDLDRPTIVGHLDVIRLFAPDPGLTATAEAQAAAEGVLQTMRSLDVLIEVNPRAVNRGALDEPYPAGWLVERARDLGCSFTLGDDSHSVDDVGEGLELAREHLLRHGVRDVIRLRRAERGVVERLVVPLA